MTAPARHPALYPIPPETAEAATALPVIEAAGVHGADAVARLSAENAALRLVVDRAILETDTENDLDAAREIDAANGYMWTLAYKVERAGGLVPVRDARRAAVAAYRAREVGK